jgi:hypothetical protein
VFTSLSELNTGDGEFDPFPADNGRQLFFCRAVEQRSGSWYADIMMADRSPISGSYGAATVASELSEELAVDANPTLTRDRLTVVFSSSRPGGKGSLDLWYAVRTGLDQPFSAPQPLAALNTLANDSESALSADGCELYFTSKRAGGLGGADLYRARFQSSAP